MSLKNDEELAEPHPLNFLYPLYPSFHSLFGETWTSTVILTAKLVYQLSVDEGNRRREGDNADVSSVSPSLWRRDNARNVSYFLFHGVYYSLQHSVDTPVCLQPRRRSYLVLLRAGITLYLQLRLRKSWVEPFVLISFCGWCWARPSFLLIASAIGKRGERLYRAMKHSGSTNHSDIGLP